MPFAASHFTYDGHVHPLRATLEGALAGLLAAVLVAFVHGFSDLVAGDLLRTPVTLSALIFDLDLARGTDRIVLLSVLHIALWLSAGVASAYAIAVADAHPRVLRLVFGILSFCWISLLYLSGALSQEATGSLQLWLGTLLGAATIAGTLLYCHPRLLTQSERLRTTDSSRAHLQEAFRFESENLAATRVALRIFKAPVLAELTARKSAALARIAAALERLEIPSDAPQETYLSADPITLELALRRAIVRERDAIKCYDGFLASTDEQALRELLLEHRFEAFDENLPSLEAALRELDPAARGRSACAGTKAAMPSGATPTPSAGHLVAIQNVETREGSTE